MAFQLTLATNSASFKTIGTAHATARIIREVASKPLKGEMSAFLSESNHDAVGSLDLNNTNPRSDTPTPVDILTAALD